MHNKDSAKLIFKWAIPVVLDTITMVMKMSQTQQVHVLFYLQGVA
jgi:hypothetical protein